MSLKWMSATGAYYGAADLTTAGDWNANSASVAVVAGAFAGSKALSLASAGGAVQKTLDASYGTLILGFRFQIDSFTDDNVPIASFSDAGTDQVVLFVHSDGTLYVKRGGTVLGTTTFALTTATWFYVEWKVKFHASTGTVDLRINQSSKLALTGQNTISTANATANGIKLLCGNTGHAVHNLFSDLYVCDTTTTHGNGDFLGDFRCEYRAPTGAGGFTGGDSLVGAATEWQAAGEAAFDGDTSYVGYVTAGHKSTYALGALSATPVAIFGVMPVAVARKDDAGTRQGATYLNDPTATASQQGATVNLGTSYQAVTDVYEVVPWSGVAWTATVVNQTEAGFVCVA